uniref:Rad60/SUMO-like domain-containing protein n=1 Tax=Oryza punctata TaxID=4537 RepID=A0A0E0JKZ8_ORYPU
MAAGAGADEEELEPLFDYSRVQPTMAFSFDDTDIEKSDIFVPCNNKRRKVADGDTNADEKGDKGEQKAAAGAKAATVVDLGEEDWLPPPPPPKAKSNVTDELEQSSVLKELRLQKQALAKFAESADDFLEKLAQTARQKVEARIPTEHIDLDKSPEQQEAREKVVVTVQDKAGQHQFRLYKGEKFGKLFRAYAKKVNLSLADLTFVFDGDKVDPENTPEDLGLEDEDMVEVLRKTL